MTTRIAPPAYAAFPSAQNSLDPYKRKLVKEAADAIHRAIVWSDTAEGTEFWSSLHKRLEAISYGEPLK
jgi:hypothetical protein